ncbi:MAG TPA: peptidase M16, partial [Prevotella sp.]|nr:peptidase M16 [Prevotella sp.]
DRMRSFLTNREASPAVSYNDSVCSIVYGNSPRVQPVKLATLGRISYERILQIYKERFSNASNFKLIVLGNIDINTLRTLLEQYVATLPSTGEKETFAKTYPNIHNCNETHIWKKEQSTPLAKVSIFYSWPESYTAKNDLTLDVLKRVLSIAYTDSVREEKGGVYGVDLEAEMDKYSDPNTILKISFTTAPEKYNMVIPVIYRQLDNIAKYGVVTTSMEKVKKYLLKQYQQAIVTNDYWEYIIYQQLRYGINYDQNYTQLVKDLTNADVRQMAKDILKSNRRIEITMMSE